MKKSLIFLALGSVFATAQAADISVFGAVDTGLMFSHSKVSGESAENTLSMESSMNETSSFGIAGSEDLGNGMKVAFHLENEFASDSGSMATENKLFDREARITLEGGFGALSFGRMGTLSSATGTYDIVYVVGDSFDGGDNNIFGLTGAGVYDNMITYQTPEFAGFQVTGQYSFKNDSAEENGVEGKATADRYAGIAATYTIGNLQTVIAYDQMMWGSKETGANREKDQHNVYLGGNYDFGLLKLFAMGQYVKGARDFAGTEDVFTMLNDDHAIDLKSREGFDGWGLHLGTVMPVAGGDWTVAVYYADGELDDGTGSHETATNTFTDGNLDIKFYGITTRYVYPLSEQASLYAGAGYGERKYDMSAKFGNVSESDSMKEKIGQVYGGLSYVF